MSRATLSKNQSAIAEIRASGLGAHHKEILQEMYYGGSSLRAVRQAIRDFRNDEVIIEASHLDKPRVRA